MNDCFGAFEECAFCIGSSDYEPCVAEIRILSGIISKLNNEEKSMFAQMLRKARDAGEKDMFEIIRIMCKIEKTSV
jgi:hypothetical protein